MVFWCLAFFLRLFATAFSTSAEGESAVTFSFVARLHTTAPSCETALSELVVTNSLSSREKLKDVTLSLCFPIVVVSFNDDVLSSPFSNSQSATRPSSNPTASFPPHDEKAAHFMSQLAICDLNAVPSAARRAGAMIHGVLAAAEFASGGGSETSSSPNWLFSEPSASGFGETSYTATSPPNTQSTRDASGNITSAWGAVSSVWQTNSGSLRVSPSKVATHTRLGMPLDFLPPPPATRTVRPSTHADAYKGMPNFLVFGVGF
mmetsp:Transcript_10478/g.38844  ORF Transcript_10478/g.38844 Transcript_10478/m.38844 type:complete len:262 (-) Transcript_10478:99-884(-)